MEQKLQYTLDEFNGLTAEKRRELFNSFSFKFIKNGVRLDPRHENLKATLVYSSKQQKENERSQ